MCFAIASTSGAYRWSAFAAQGGTNSGYQWTLDSGSLPPGISGIPGSGTPTVALTGTLSQSGQFSFRVRVEDDGGNFETHDFVWTIASAPPPSTDGSSGSSGSSGCTAAPAMPSLWLMLALLGIAMLKLRHGFRRLEP